MTSVHVVLPAGVDDPGRPSGGNHYDARVCAGLGDAGWTVHRHLVAGEWPAPDPTARDALRRVLAGVPDGARVLVDGLVASVVPDLLVPASRRVRVAVVVHLPRGHPDVDGMPARPDEAAVLRAAHAVVVPSRWTRDWLVGAYGLDPGRVTVATPGVDAAPATVGGADADRLLCVGAVTPTKGVDRLVDALADLADLPWSCRVVGSTAVDPPFARQVGERIGQAGLDGRVTLVGVRPAEAMGAEYVAADLLVVPSRLETWGMVVTEALARGVPVVAADVGGVAEAVGDSPRGRPGLLVPPAGLDLAGALRRWLIDPVLRQDLRAAAAARRERLDDWSTTSAAVAAALATLHAGVPA